MQVGSDVIWTQHAHKVCIHQVVPNCCTALVHLLEHDGRHCVLTVRNTGLVLWKHATSAETT